MDKATKVGTGITMFMDGPRLDAEAEGYAVVWRNGQIWHGGVSPSRSVRIMGVRR